MSARRYPVTGYVLDSSGYGLAAFRVAGALGLSFRFQQRDEGVPRRPGGPPHLSCCQSNYLSEAHTQHPVIIEQTGTGYPAYSPDVSGCVAVGDFEEEIRRSFQEALVAHFEARREVGEPIPEPHSPVDYVEVAA